MFSVRPVSQNLALRASFFNSQQSSRVVIKPEEKQVGKLTFRGEFKERLEHVFSAMAGDPANAAAYHRENLKKAKKDAESLTQDNAKKAKAVWEDAARIAAEAEAAVATDPTEAAVANAAIAGAKAAAAKAWLVAAEANYVVAKAETVAAAAVVSAAKAKSLAIEAAKAANLTADKASGEAAVEAANADVWLTEAAVKEADAAVKKAKLTARATASRAAIADACVNVLVAECRVQVAVHKAADNEPELAQAKLAAAKAALMEAEEAIVLTPEEIKQANTSINAGLRLEDVWSDKTLPPPPPLFPNAAELKACILTSSRNLQTLTGEAQPAAATTEQTQAPEQSPPAKQIPEQSPPARLILNKKFTHNFSRDDLLIRRDSLRATGRRNE
ncbi:TPA: hypothetical protein QCH65_001641 [Enterobacter roggenkampii]|nr:hypothetical protein [Enterobacter roggenkampii]